MTREPDKAFLGFECDPSLASLVKADALRKAKTVSSVLRGIVTSHYLSSLSASLKGAQENTEPQRTSPDNEFEGRK